MKRLIMAVFLLLGAIPVQAGVTWEYAVPMPHGRYGHAATLGKDGNIYVMGGIPALAFSDGRFLLPNHNGVYSNLSFDRGQGLWSYRDPVPGWETGGTLLLYDKEKERWQVLEFKGHRGEFYALRVRLPSYKLGEYIEMHPDQLRNTDFERQGNGVAIVTAPDGKVWWIGGMGQSVGFGRGENHVFPYDPEKDKWPKVTAERVRSPAGGNFSHRTVFPQDVPRMQERRIDHRAVVTSDGRVYVMGGYRLEPEHSSYAVAAASDTMECYDQETNRWEYKKSLSSERMLFATAVGPDDRIYVFGGAQGMANRDATPILDTTEIYDPKTDTWSKGRPMPEPRYGHTAVMAADGKIYVMGGSANRTSGPMADTFIYDPKKDSWERGPTMNRPRSCLAAVATPDGKIYAIGGSDVGAYKGLQKLNFFLPKSYEFYTGEVQNTVEVLNVLQ